MNPASPASRSPADCPGQFTRNAGWKSTAPSWTLPAADRRRRVNTVSVAVNYFDALGVRIVSGRAFRSGDLGADPGPVIVNQSFVQRVLQGRNAIGRRVRYLEDGWQEAGAAAETHEPWHEIVGVVPDLGTIHDDPHDLSALYHPVAPGAILPAHIAVHVRGEPGTFAARLRTIAAEVDPTLRLYDVTPLNRVGGGMWNEFDFLWRLLMMMSSLAILLSLSGIYAAVSFAVSRRRREIGIRVALGARPRGIVTAILRQPFSQVGTRRRRRRRPGPGARRSSEFVRAVVRRSGAGRLLRRIHDGRLPAGVHRPDHAGAPH